MTEPTVHPDSQSVVILPFLYPPPPFRLSFHLCVALYRRACLLSLWDLPWNVPFGVVSCAKRRELAASSVARVCRLTPLQDF